MEVLGDKFSSGPEEAMADVAVVICHSSEGDGVGEEAIHESICEVGEIFVQMFEMGFRSCAGVCWQLVFALGTCIHLDVRVERGDVGDIFYLLLLLLDGAFGEIAAEFFIVVVEFS